MDTVTKELVVFWRKLGRLLDSGVPLMKSLDVLWQETSDVELKQAIGLLFNTIKDAGTFEEGLAKSPNLFPLSVRTIVKVGETTGRLDRVPFAVADGIEDGSLLTHEVKPLLAADTANPRTDEPAPPSGGIDQVSGEDVPIIKRASMIIAEAVEARASDIHLESTDGDLRVRFRVDGVLRDMPRVPVQFAATLLSRFKIMANLDVAEKKLPQDGRIQLSVKGQRVDLRVSCIPCLDGENMVMRVLMAPAKLPTLEMQGFTAPQLATLRAWMAKPSGLILVVGPIGCGKTTTIYSMVQELNQPGLKILMAEDPVELRIPGVSQMQIRPAQGVTFAAALRSFLRQDPDVIVTTEIRDLDAAHMMVHAALTGHLVMSSLHTEDTAEALQRLVDVGVDRFLLNSTVIGVVAQRLVRVVCPKCREPYQPTSAMPDSVKMPDGAQFVRGKGCEHCGGSGYRGRTAIHELMEMNDALRKAVKEDTGPSRFKELAVRSGMVALRDDGIAKAAQGITTLDEVLRVC